MVSKNIRLNKNFDWKFIREDYMGYICFYRNDNGSVLIRGYIYKYLEHDIYHDLSTVKKSLFSKWHVLFQWPKVLF